MSENTPEAPPVEAEVDVEVDTEPFDEARAAEKIKKANSEAANLRKRLKELEPLAQEAQQLKESQKTEQQRMAERLAELEKTASERSLEALRLEVAMEKGLTKAQARRLVGSTAEELAADADELLASFGSTRRFGDVDQGVRKTQAAPQDPKSLADAVLAQRGY